MTRAAWRGVGFAGIIAALGWSALTIEFVNSVGASLDKGRGLAEALYLFFRYFTILTNILVAVLMTATVIQVLRRRPPPPAWLHAAALVYILVVCATYELMLRRQWTPRGVQIVTDTIFHDLVPLLTLAFWLAFAPKQGLTRRFAAWLLGYPALYFAVTLGAGALGADYPYSFLDVSKLGYPTVLKVAVLFLAIFYALGLAVTALAARRCEARPKADIALSPRHPPERAE